jgi:hypothetical protein
MTARWALHALLTACAAVLAAGCAGTVSGPPSTAGGAVVFAVGAEAEHLYVRPIVRHDNGRYAAPPCPPDLAARRFVEEHLPAGRRLAIVSGGRRVGTATVTAGERGAADTCLALQRPVRVTLEGAVAIGAWNEALAVPLDAVHENPGRLQRFTLGHRHHPDERISRLLVGAGVPARAAARLRVSGHALGRNGRDVLEVIEAHTEFDAVQAADDWHDVFLIRRAPDRQGRQETLLAAYARAEAGRQAQFCATEVLDALDLDGDGELEIVVRFNCTEGAQYGVYAAAGGVWQLVYRGAYYPG